MHVHENMFYIIKSYMTSFLIFVDVPIHKEK